LSSYPVGRCARGLVVAACAISASLPACGVEVLGDDPPLDALFRPVGLALHPEGRYLYVVNSNFDALYRADRGGTVAVVDTDALEVEPAGSVQIGTFGGQIALNQRPDGPTRAYVAVRGDQAVMALDLEDDGRLVRCQGARYTASCALGVEYNDPFAVSVQSFTREVGGQAQDVDFIATGHLISQFVTGLTVQGEDLSALTRLAAPLSAGTNDFAVSPRTGQLYAAVRFDNVIATLRPVFGATGELEGLFGTSEIPIERAAPSSGVDSRGIAFSGDGNLAFVSNRGPASLLLVDTGPTDPQGTGGAANRLVDVIPMPAEPSEVAVAEVDGRELVYVAAFQEGFLMVVDPALRAIVARVELPGSPYGLAVDVQRHKRLYATLFDRDSVAVVDLDPTSPSFHQVIAEVP
jgi:DNA-binding beta-propeller fold protein YncE